MADDRSLPPSPRRLGLAHRAGLHAASPTAVAAVAWVAAAIGLAGLGRALGAGVGEAIRAACTGAPGLTPAAVVPEVLSRALPLAALIAIAAVLAHLVQTRGLWLPRRRVPGAPVAEPHRARRALIELAGALVIAGVAFGWLWIVAPRLATLVEVAQLPAGGALLLALIATLATAWVALGAIDALLRRADLARDLAMSHADKRDDDRLAAADPRWRARRAAAARATGPVDLEAAVAGASLLVLGDDVAVAIAWDPVRRPVPMRTAAGRATRATQLLGLARRYRLPVHRDPALAAALVAARSGDGTPGAIDELHWPRLAELVVATRGQP